MIQSVRIADVASYDAETLSKLSAVNFLFGPNGAGKSTIARIIRDESSYSDCEVTWQGGRKLDPLVYGRDFVKQNVDQSPHLEGVFTLGDDQVQIQKKIAEKKKEIDDLVEEVEGLTSTLQGEDGNGGKRGELVELERRFEEKCWEKKQKLDEDFATAFQGVRHSKTAFKEEVLTQAGTDTVELLSLNELRERAATVFDSTAKEEAKIKPLGPERLIRCNQNSVLERSVVGKSDVDIADMIERLGNSDWVRTGMKLLEQHNEVCPFCQRPIEEQFARKLERYFDESYEESIRAIKELETRYRREWEGLRQRLGGLLGRSGDFLNAERLTSLVETLDSLVGKNLERIGRKKDEPSQSVALDPVSELLTTIQEIIQEANYQIKKHNEMVGNLEDETRQLKAKIWKYVTDSELRVDLQQYYEQRSNLNKAIKGLEEKIRDTNQDRKSLEREVQRLERKSTSVQPTVNAINDLLAAFGFESFSLSTTKEGHRYKLVRPDGADAKETLSEGEKSFLAFLYFFHLVKGSASSSGTMTDRVVVFDDPVSSLDADILFVVASLIKDLISQVREGDSHVRQVFIFTHNVYFHKEVTFHPKRSADARLSDETFWTVRKRNMTSRLQRHSSNPVKTAYELLWAEVRNPDRSNLTIRNTLRRILENYFQILGNFNRDEICSKFEGKERIICGSLFDWVHAGSHYAHGDLYVGPEEARVEAYLDVFRKIFERTGHEAHYQMMMGVDGESTPEI